MGIFFFTQKPGQDHTKRPGIKIKSEVPDKMYPGMLITYDVTPLPFMKSKWVTEITHVDEPNYFVDEQRFGPYSFWHHKHYFNEVDDGVEITDVVDYAIPLGPIGDILNHLSLKKSLNISLITVQNPGRYFHQVNYSNKI